MRLGWHSTLTLPNGYATSSRALTAALQRRGVKLGYRYVYGPGTPFPFPEPHSCDSATMILAGRPIDADWPQVVYAQGDVLERNFGRRRVGFTMLEVDGLPAEWVRQANTMDEVWVPSTFNRETFADAGVRVPIHVVPLGVDTDRFRPGPPGGRPARRPFVFLSVFEWGERKGADVLLRAFNREFDRRDPVVLVCHAQNRDPRVSVREEASRLDLRPSGGRVVMVVNRHINDAELPRLYQAADCFVLSSRGEGWGLPALEAMASGLPVIATDWSALTEFVRSEHAYPLPIEGLVPAVALCPYYAGLRWAEPSGEALRGLMRRVVDDPDAARATGARAAAWVRERLTWDHAAAAVVARLEAIA